MLHMVPVEEAQDLLINLVSPMEEIEIDLFQAQGFVLSRDLRAPYPLPPFDRSSVDGFALRARDTKAASLANPARLNIIEAVSAGQTPCSLLHENTAVQIATGAPLPQGADCVVRFEDTACDGNQVLVTFPLRPGKNVIFAGEDVAAGQLAITSGKEIDAAAAGLLASLGHKSVFVHRRPRAALFLIGDELVPAGGPLPYGKIYNSNLYAVAALIQEAGGTAIPMGITGDEEDLTARHYKKGLDTGADLVISTGGASVGKRDITKQAMEKAGARILFWKMACKPGPHVVCSLKDGRLLVGLSGNPAAAITTFTLLVRPLLRRMAGHREIFLPKVEAQLVTGLAENVGYRRFVRAQAWWEGKYLVRPTGRQGSGALQSLLQGNALIDLPPGSQPLKPGDTVQVIILKS